MSKVYQEMGDQRSVTQKRIIIKDPPNDEAISAALENSFADIFRQLYKTSLIMTHQPYVICLESDVLNDQTGALKNPECCTFAYMSFCPVNELEDVYGD